MEDERRSLPARVQNVILENRSKLHVSGVEEVLSFDANAVVMRTALGTLCVRGSGLRVERLTVESGDLAVEGEIESLNYEQAPLTWWERLFG